MKLPGVTYTSPKKFRPGQRVQLALIPPAAASAARVLCGLNRIEVRGRHHYTEILEQAGHVIFGIWHETAIMAAHHHRGSGFHAMTSYSFDGELAARFLAWMGIQSVRGSSSQGGAKGLRDIKKALGLISAVGLTMDGPRGPRRRAKPGLAILSACTGIPIIPHAFAAEGRWRLNTWDRFCVPKPFGRIICAYAPPIPAPARLSREEVEATRFAVETSLNELHAQLEEELNDPQTIAPAEPESEPPPDDSL